MTVNNFSLKSLKKVISGADSSFSKKKKKHGKRNKQITGFNWVGGKNSD